MAFRINQNITALNTHRYLSRNSAFLNRAMERLSSGLRINRASDDAAGLAISEKLRAQVRGLQQASRNVLDGISLIQTAEGSLNETHSILQRVRELAVQAANDTLTSDERSNIQSEIDSLLAEVDRIGTSTEFNTKKLLDGSSATTALNFQVGANTGQSIAVTIATANTAVLTIDSLNISSHTFASQAIASIDNALTEVSSQRARLGAIQNRLEYTVSNLNVTSENLGTSESRIRDADMASEMIAFTRYRILQQAGIAMLAQANLVPQQVLKLVS